MVTRGHRRVRFDVTANQRTYIARSRCSVAGNCSRAQERHIYLATLRRDESISAAIALCRLKQRTDLEDCCAARQNEKPRNSTGRNDDDVVNIGGRRARQKHQQQRSATATTQMHSTMMRIERDIRGNQTCEFASQSSDLSPKLVC